MNRRTVFFRFAGIVLPILVGTFVLAIVYYEWSEHRQARTELETKLDKLVHVYSLLYSEPVATDNLDIIRMVTVALIADTDVAVVSVENADGQIIDGYGDVSDADPKLLRSMTISFASDESFQSVGTLTLGLTSQRLQNKIRDTLFNAGILLALLIVSASVSVYIAFYRAVGGPLHTLSYQAGHDELTDLPNRRTFERHLESLTQGRRIADHEHVLVLLDLDNFKAVNDACGHAAGDAVLRQAAQVLSANIRDNDLVARIGGDEFGVVLRNCEPGAAYSIAEMLRQKLSAHVFVWNDQEFRVRASIGIAPIQPGKSAMKQTMALADAASLRAKRRGGDRVHHAGADDVETTQPVSS